VYSEFPADRDFARALTVRDCGYAVGRRAEVPRAFVEF
jgi:hypothetical protein